MSFRCPRLAPVAHSRARRHTDASEGELLAHHRTTQVFAGLVVAAPLIAACGGGGDEAEVRPFAEVQADEFVFENDPTSSERGILRVTTTEPMICAIVWGETEDPGSFNTSLAMNGTGSVDHDALPAGAEPGATYLFHVKGWTADRTLYQSELATFTLPERDDATATASPEHGPDLAGDGTVADVSSEFNHRPLRRTWSPACVTLLLPASRGSSSSDSRHCTNGPARCSRPIPVDLNVANSTVSQRSGPARPRNRRTNRVGSAASTSGPELLRFRKCSRSSSEEASTTMLSLARWTPGRIPRPAHSVADAARTRPVVIRIGTRSGRETFRNRAVVGRGFVVAERHFHGDHETNGDLP